MGYALLPAMAGGLAIAWGWPVGGAAGLTTGLLLAVRGGGGAPVPPLPRGPERWFILGAVLVAAATRLPGIGFIPPPGIHIDEHRSVWFAVEVLRGERIWPPPDGAEPLSVWAFALAFLPAGPSLAAARAMMALAGTISVPLLWWALRPAAGATVAVLAAYALAALRWHILLSRIAQPYVLVPLAAILSLGLLVRATRAGTPRGWWIAGAATGLAPYTYLAGRIIPPIVALAALAQAPRRRALWTALGGLVLVLLPLLLHYADDPRALTFRVEHLSREVRARPLTAGVRHLADTLLAFTVRGDGALSSSWPRAADAPIIGPLALALLVVGLPALGGAATGTAGLLLGLLGLAGLGIGALAGMSWPSFADRTAVLVPAIVVAQALALAGATGGRPRRVVAAAGLLLAAGAWDGAGFVVPALRGADSREVERWTGWPETRLARALGAVAAGRPVFLTPDTSRESAVYTKFRGACLLAGVRVMDPPAADWAQIAARGGVGVMLDESREHRELVRECYPGIPPLLVPEPGAAAAPGPLTLFTATSPPRFPLGEFAALHAGVRTVGDLAAERKLDEGFARLAELERRWPRLGALAALRASILAATGPDAFPAAERAARRALALSDGRSAIAQNVLGFVALRARDYATARERFARSLDLDPNQPDIRENLLQLTRMTGGW